MMRPENFQEAFAITSARIKQGVSAEGLDSLRAELEASRVPAPPACGVALRRLPELPHKDSD